MLCYAMLPVLCQGHLPQGQTLGHSQVQRQRTRDVPAAVTQAPQGVAERSCTCCGVCSRQGSRQNVCRWVPCLPLPLPLVRILVRILVCVAEGRTGKHPGQQRGPGLSSRQPHGRALLALRHRIRSGGFRGGGGGNNTCTASRTAHTTVNELRTPVTGWTSGSTIKAV